MRFVALHDLSPTRNLRHHPPHGCRPARSEIVASFPTSPLAWIGDICEVEARQRRQVPYPSPAPAAHFVASSPFDPARFEWIRTSGVVPRWRQLPIPPHLLGGGAAVPPEHYLGRLGWTRMQLRCPISVGLHDLCRLGEDADVEAAAAPHCRPASASEAHGAGRFRYYLWHGKGGSSRCPRQTAGSR
uniref:Uncharacterized protein n=1 Tax=Setaria viridis TaxID=4556 RepID=A0A4U6U7W9_SETVI|nr:hypothetical protein SEVIR_6G107800v2 [Setaria viridis]